MNPKKLRKIWGEYCVKNNIQLNPDDEHVNLIIKGLLENEKKFGLKLCPCKLRDGTKERDFELICPCNFEIQETWKSKGQCWCGLFFKKKKET